MNQHPLSALFPPISKAQAQELVDDIILFGQRVPGIVYQGMILDGWCRYSACKASNQTFKYDIFEGEYIEAVKMVMSLNLNRRHLTDNDRIVLGAELVEIMKQRKMGHNHHTPKEKKTGVRKEGHTINVVSKALGVGRGSISRAVYLKKHNPDKFKECKDGVESVSNAYRKAHLKESAVGELMIPNSFSWWHDVDKFLKQMALQGWECHVLCRNGQYEAKFVRCQKEGVFRGEYTIIKAITAATLEIKSQIKA